MGQSDVLKAVVIGVMVGVIGLAVVLFISQSASNSSDVPQGAFDVIQNQIDGLERLITNDPAAPGAQYQSWDVKIYRPSKLTAADFPARYPISNLAPDDLWCYSFKDNHGGGFGMVLKMGDEYRLWSDTYNGRAGWNAVGC